MTDTERLRAALIKIMVAANSGNPAALPAIAELAHSALNPEPAPNTRPELTQRQCEFEDFIRDFIRSHGYAPSVREIGKGLNIKSPNGVMAQLKAMAKKGRLSWTPDTARSIVLIGGGA